MASNKRKLPTCPQSQGGANKLSGGKPRSHYINFMGFGWMTRLDAVKLCIFIALASVGLLSIIFGLFAFILCLLEVW